MHDPMTQIHRNRFFTLWHVDPESGGNDDSCDWHGSNTLTDDERAWLRKEGEGEHDFFFRGILKRDEEPDGALVENPREERWPGGMVNASGFEVLYGIASIIFWRMPRKGGPLHGQRFSSWRLRRELAAAVPTLLGLVSHPSDNVFSLISDARACDDSGKEAMGRLFVCVARNLRRGARPWWRHPRWHVRHWSITVHPWRSFNRWAWSRCATCGKRFAWGESPVTHSWHGTGPRFLRGEKDVHHGACMGVRNREGGPMNRRAPQPA